MRSNKEKKTKKKRLKIKFLSPEASIYKTSATIILRGKSSKAKKNENTKPNEFLSIASISFDKGDES